MRYSLIESVLRKLIFFLLCSCLVFLAQSSLANENVYLVKNFVYPVSNFVDFKGKAYFADQNFLSWTNGMDPGTGSIYTFDDYIYGLWLINDALYFGADDGTHGRELWKSGGTYETTYMIKDIVPGLNDSNP